MPEPKHVLETGDKNSNESVYEQMHTDHAETC